MSEQPGRASTDSDAPATPADRPRIGRPPGSGSLYTEEIAERICEQISDGVPLRQVCREPGMPSYGAVYDWIETRPAFASRFARARSMGYDAIAEEALAIANSPVEGEEVTEDTTSGGDAGPVTRTSRKRGDMLGHRKLQVETRLKLLAKWDPKRYGDRLNLAGEDGGPIRVVQYSANMPKRGEEDAEPGKSLSTEDSGDVT